MHLEFVSAYSSNAFMDWCHCIEEQYRVTLAPWICNVLEGHREGIHWAFSSFFLALLIGGCEGRFWDYGMLKSSLAVSFMQSGKFGKLNKQVHFSEDLDLMPYMSANGDRPPHYKLYAIVVHVDIFNASYFGHYICLVKNSRGSWYQADDAKVIFILSNEQVCSTSMSGSVHFMCS